LRNMAPIIKAHRRAPVGAALLQKTKMSGFRRIPVPLPRYPAIRLCRRPSMSDPTTTSPAPQDENQLIAERREKLQGPARGPASGQAAWPSRMTSSQAITGSGPAGPPRRQDGRSPARRRHCREHRRAHDAQARHGQGQLCHPAGRDGTLPALCHARRRRRGGVRRFKHWDLGDIVAAEGKLFKTRTGELSLHASRVRLLTKSLRPMPDKFHGVADQEVKYRQRYVDLMTDQAARDRFVARSKAVSSIRDFMVGTASWRWRRPCCTPSRGGQCQAFRDAPQRAGPADVPAHRARAVPQAADRRRLRAGVRDQPQLPQRRHRCATTPSSP
jgi:hypothetical protein